MLQSRRYDPLGSNEHFVGASIVLAPKPRQEIKVASCYLIVLCRGGPFSDMLGRSPFSDIDTVAVIAVLVGSALSKVTSCHLGLVVEKVSR